VILVADLVHVFGLAKFGGRALAGDQTISGGRVRAALVDPVAMRVLAVGFGAFILC
jgi:hypothetical protein